MKLNVEQLEPKQMLTATADYIELTTDDVAVFADGERPTPSNVTENVWSYSNTENEKINWYIYNQDLTGSDLNTVGDLSELYVKFGDVASHGVGLYFTVYTAPQKDGGDAASWYRSRINFTGDYSFFQDTDDSLSARVASVRYDISSSRFENNGVTYAQVALNLDPWSSRGPMDDSELVSFIAISTSSGQPEGTEQFSISNASIGWNEPQDRHYDFYNFVTIASDLSQDSNFKVTRITPSMYQVDVKPIAIANTVFIINQVYGDGLMIWDVSEQQWNDPTELPTSSNPRELLKLLQKRVVEEGDILYWTPTEGSSETTPIFSYVTWNRITYESSPLKILFAELGSNIGQQ